MISYAGAFKKELGAQKIPESDYTEVLLPKKILIGFLRLQTHHSQQRPDSLLPRFRASLKMPQED